jgi:hypothetical protein
MIQQLWDDAHVSVQALETQRRRHNVIQRIKPRQ